ncbi:hypothetical protein NIES2130_36025 [Scytonema sp. HK-05]|nr:hypothetical protein NIES2130_36025 [Scytonema sp. HK-05]
MLTQDKPDPSQYPSQYKVFLCHNSIDKPEIRQIRDQLRQQGIETWMDEKDIMGFDDWKKKIKENLSQMNAIAVFLGSSGFGEWQKYEIKCTEEEISRRDNTLFTLRRETTPRVGLVILPSCQHTFQEIQNQYYHTPYGWLFNYHAVDLRTSKAPMQELIGAITGQLRNSNVDVDSLLSERGVNYTRLRNFLRAGQWKQADQETLAVMLKATGREEEGWLSTESIENFPCTDLRTIDQLWVKYSNGRFGFSVQKRIWESVGGKPDADIEIWEKFGDRVGWRRRKGSSLWLQKEWLEYSELTFTTEAPAGHLPLGVGIMGSSWRNGDGISSLTSRLIKCNL